MVGNVDVVKNFETGVWNSDLLFLLNCLIQSSEHLVVFIIYFMFWFL